MNKQTNGETMLQKNIYLRRIRTIADYQFGKGVGKLLFPDHVEFQFSTTGRVRQVLLGNERLATVRAKDGMLTPGITGARKLHEVIQYPGRRVVVNSDSAPFVAKGKNAFAKHVVAVDPDVRAGEEVMVVDENDVLLAVGKAVLCAVEMLAFKKGMAVEVRSGSFS
jgi:uncharacterized protein with predicted RNA binding PUA domain